MRDERDPMLRRTRIGTWCVLLTAVFVTGCGERPQIGTAKGPATGPAPARAIDVESARFRAAVCQTQLPANRVDEMDAAALGAIKAKTAGDFRTALAKLGKTKLLYQVDQVVDLRKERIKLSAKAPMVTGSRRTGGGQTTRMIQYARVGALFDIEGKQVEGPEGKSVHVRLTIDLSALSDSGVEIAEGVPAPIVRQVTLTYKGPVEPGRPIVMVSIDSSAGGKDAKPAAFVARVIIGDAGQ